MRQNITWKIWNLVKERSFFFLVNLGFKLRLHTAKQVFTK
jgi:hypothetical protein